MLEGRTWSKDPADGGPGLAANWRFSKAFIASDHNPSSSQSEPVLAEPAGWAHYGVMFLGFPTLFYSPPSSGNALRGAGKNEPAKGGRVAVGVADGVAPGYHFCETS